MRTRRRAAMRSAVHGDRSKPLLRCATSARSGSAHTDAPGADCVWAIRLGHGTDPVQMGEPNLGADVAGVSPVLVQMWQG